MHLFTGILATVMWQHQKCDSALNKQKPERGVQAVWDGHAMACPDPALPHRVTTEAPPHTEWENTAAGSDSGDGCSPIEQGEQKKR